MQSEDMKNSTTLPDLTGKDPVKCWELLGCKEEICPAYHSKNLHCWLITGTHCNSKIQGEFIEKIELCCDCSVFKTNMSPDSVKIMLRETSKQFERYRRIVRERDEELEKIGLELSISLSEVFEALKRIASGDPSVKIDESSKIDLISKLKHMVNTTAGEIKVIVDQCHEFAICFAEHFDVFHRVSRGDLSARVSGVSDIELMESMKKVINTTIDSISREISNRESAEEEMRRSEEKYRTIFDNTGTPTIIVGEDTTISLANAEFEKFAGYTKKELEEKKSWLEFVMSDDMDRVKEWYNVRLPDFQGTPAYYDFRFVNMNGNIRDTLAVVSRIPGTKKRVLSFLETTDYEQTEQRLQRLSALHGIDMAITASLDLRVTLNILLDHVTTQLKTDAATVLLLNPYNQTLEYAASSGFRSRTIQQTRLRLGEGHAGRAALERRLIAIPNVFKTDDPCARSHMLAGEVFIAHHAVPLIAKGQVKGVLEVFHRSQLIPDSEWLDFFEALASQAAIAIENASLFDQLQRSNAELSLAYETTLEGWSRALEIRDKETEGHTLRVAEMTINLSRIIGVRDPELVHIRRGALLHDIGKMGITDGILLKNGPLTEDEYELMRKHPEYAYELLLPIKFLRPALNIPYCHHERWNGTGYPRGLKGEQIPLEARIFTIVDVWDALLSDRPYRPAWSKEDAIDYIREKAGSHFDPKVAETFLRLYNEPYRESPLSIKD